LENVQQDTIEKLNHNQNPYTKNPYMNWQNQLPNPSTTNQKALQFFLHWNQQALRSGILILL
jgi:hypothetical protein